MSEYSLRARYALNLDRPVDERWDEFSVREITGLTIFFVAAGPQPAPVEKAIRRWLGMELPAPGRFERTDAATVAWLGEREWMVSAETLEVPEQVDRVVAVSDQSDGWSGIRIEGSSAREVLARLCPLDLHPYGFMQGACARTPVEGLHCHIRCIDSAIPVFEIFFQRSSARSFLDAIREAAYSVCGERTDGSGVASG